jgi:molybdopterin-guanine dinucleotide biosynthesis protein A
VRISLQSLSRANDPSPQSSPLQEGERRNSCRKLTAVLLAGGESRRMGRDKASIIIRGKPLWEHQLEKLRTLEPEEVFVSARIAPLWRPDDIRFVADTAPSRGPLSGLAASLGQIKTTHLLALAIDMPAMSYKYLEFLCTQIVPGRGVVPKIGDRAEPLAAIYPREAAIEFHNALRGPDFSLQSVLRNLVASGKLSELSVAEAHKKLFRNANIASELRSA